MNDELSPESADPGSDSASPMPPAPDTEPAAPQGPATAGGLICAARRAQGLDQASLAAMLKIPLRKLEALEAGRHEDLQGPTFERALAQAACRVLKIDPKPVLALLPQVVGNSLEHVSGGLNRPFREQRELADPEALLRPMVVVPALLVVGALALFFLPEGTLPRLLQSGAAIVGASAPSATVGASAPIAAPGEQPALAASAVNAPTPADGVPPASAPKPGSAPDPAAATTAPAATATVPTPLAATTGVDEVLAHAAPPPSIPLQVNGLQDTWVEVVDAQGHTLLSRTVVAGESVGLDGTLPMKVKVGNVRGTRLTLRGDNVDLAPYTHDNVARLELK